MASHQIEQLLAKNRAEELGFDVWGQFVIPPFYQRLSIGNTLKPQVIIGGRGCGKTILLRYLSHESSFSRKRKEIPNSALSHIGLYWRADTQFASSMQGRGIPDDIWSASFRHLAAIVLGIEVLRSLESIAQSKIGVLTQEMLETLDFSRLRPYSQDLPIRFGGLRDHLEDCVARFEAWVNNVRSMVYPQFLPGYDFLKRLITLVCKQLPVLKSAVFFVYLDEYENLTIYQQRIINTWMKHSEPPLVFNLAMKRNGFKTRLTEDEEALSDIHDYRDIDIENFDLNTEFPMFAAEILLLRLQPEINVVEMSPDALSDAAQLHTRKDMKYADQILNAVKTIFPSPKQSELASQVLVDPVLRNRLNAKIEKALLWRNVELVESEKYLLAECPEASVIVPALLHRLSLTVAEIDSELANIVKGKVNRFTGPTNWIHNNFVGCYLQLYDGLTRPCPLYSGFMTFCFISRGNLRHFLELCHQAFARLAKSDSTTGLVPIEQQADAARQVSADFLGEVRSFGPQGNNFHTFLLRLGSVLSLAQQQPSQSEPERTHFSIQGGMSALDKAKCEFLSEAIKWSVLFEEKETKKKNESDPEGTEYILNPIYAAYFHISYRKRRKIDLSARQAEVLISGSYNEVKDLLKEYQRRWSVDLTEDWLPLFAHLRDENTP